MPIYEYACDKCGEAFERRLKVEQRREAQECPECGQAGGQLRMSVPAMVGAHAQSDAGTCPSTGAACGCGHAMRN